MLISNMVKGGTHKINLSVLSGLAKTSIPSGPADRTLPFWSEHHHSLHKEDLPPLDEGAVFEAGSRTRSIVDCVIKIIYGASAEVSDPEARKFVEFILNRANDMGGKKFKNWSTAGLEKKLSIESDHLVRQAGIDYRFRMFIPKVAGPIFRSWTGSTGADSNAGPPPVHYVEMIEAQQKTQSQKRSPAPPATGRALIPGSVPFEPLTAEEITGLLSKAAWCAQLTTILAMLSKRPPGEPPQRCVYRTGGYLKKNDGQSELQLQALKQGKTMKQHVLTSVSTSPRFGTCELGIYGLRIQLPAGIRAPQLSDNQIYEHEQERNLACVNLVPVRQLSEQTFEVRAVLDVDAIRHCIDQCVQHAVLSKEQAQDLWKILAREPAVIAAS
jgi:hypothetical protein